MTRREFMASSSAFLAAHALGKGVDTKEVAVGCEMAIIDNPYVKDGLVNAWNLSYATKNGIVPPFAGDKNLKVDGASFEIVDGGIRLFGSSIIAPSIVAPSLPCTFEYDAEVSKDSSNYRVVFSSLGIMRHNIFWHANNVDWIEHPNIYNLANSAFASQSNIKNKARFAYMADTNGNVKFYYGNNKLIDYTYSSTPTVTTNTTLVSSSSRVTLTLSGIRIYNRLLSIDELEHNRLVNF